MIFPTPSKKIFEVILFVCVTAKSRRKMESHLSKFLNTYDFNNISFKIYLF